MDSRFIPDQSVKYIPHVVGRGWEARAEITIGLCRLLLYTSNPFCGRDWRPATPGRHRALMVRCRMYDVRQLLLMRHSWRAVNTVAPHHTISGATGCTGRRFIEIRGIRAGGADRPDGPRRADRKQIPLISMNLLPGCSGVGHARISQLLGSGHVAAGGGGGLNENGYQNRERTYTYTQTTPFGRRRPPCAPQRKTLSADACQRAAPSARDRRRGMPPSIHLGDSMSGA